MTAEVVRISGFKISDGLRQVADDLEGQDIEGVVVIKDYVYFLGECEDQPVYAIGLIEVFKKVLLEVE